MNDGTTTGLLYLSADLSMDDDVRIVALSKYFRERREGGEGASNVHRFIAVGIPRLKRAPRARILANCETRSA